MIAVTITVPLIAVAVVSYIVLNPEKAEKLAGWIWRGGALIFGSMDRKAVAYSVQGDVNTARAALVKDAPDGVIGGKLRVQWADPEEAQALIRDGDVVVFMKRSRQREENLANAVMAYLPKAVVPRARRYVDKETMRAADLTIARAILQYSAMPTGAMDVFFERHLDPALADTSELRARLEAVDAIDLHGWLTRLMLSAYREMGDMLYPGECDAVCLGEARQFCTWLARLATREPDDFTIPLKYQGRYLSAGIVFVATRGRLEREGLTPYRAQAKRLIYKEKCNAVYLMARDANIPSVRNLRDDLAGDALVESVATYEYPLRADFAARILRRERAIIVVLHRLRGADETTLDIDEEAVPGDLEIYDPAIEALTVSDTTELDAQS